MVNPTLFSVTGNPLYQEFLAALKNPHFMRRRSTLGFYCRYKYTDTSTDLDKFHPFLKGEDAIVYKIAKTLGLSIALKPLLSKDIEDWQPKPVKHVSTTSNPYQESPNEKDNFFIPKFTSYRIGDDCITPGLYVLRKNFDDLEEVENIRWCQIP